MSLRSKLLKWLVIPLLAVNLAGAAAAYWLAWMPAQAALDQIAQQDHRGISGAALAIIVLDGFGQPPLARGG